MASHRSVFGAVLFGAWLGWAPPIAAAADACPPVAMAPPKYPPGLQMDGGQGTTVLVLTVDGCGRVSAATVERGSGYDELDAAAVAAARGWVVGKQRHHRVSHDRVRIPVEFKLGEPVSGLPDFSSDARRPRDAYFDRRRGMKATAPPRLPDGKLPGYVADEYPIGIASVEGAVALLEAHGQKRPTLVDGVDEYLFADAEGFSRWIVLSKGFAFAPSVYRLRAVSDGTNGFFVTSSLCGAAQRDACAALDAYLQAQPPQAAIEP